MNIVETLVYSTVLILGQQEHYLQGSTHSSRSSVPLLLLALDDDNDNDDDYSEASEASSVKNTDNSNNDSTKGANNINSSSKSHPPNKGSRSWLDIGKFLWNRPTVDDDDDDAELERVFQPSLPSMTKVTANATPPPPPPPPPSTAISRRRPSQIDYLVNILTRSQPITQYDLILFSTTSTATTAGNK
ncbi:hypothetical protein FRACYDRAFT_243801 [Fragilariopsis cylindrus CCMP1102]|uniref:Uncharacterized protein n=1 Tax=Fragilariopsis cylindrus CCMP1102 TaxID=635003 RepID=A0A1E7F329_9STRA|nr:hypothetical protein FRACYDRAFT_243801 [Fragilariopsis cylindrus CCMP1102]|eukprot:OEU12549.1 hypothetical protein FRACYDRAFT_243801 [Fragilariopsis cylindrus CCMP1102]